jgi:Zn-dependent M28 family amino/carboxypeptidase
MRSTPSYREHTATPSLQALESTVSVNAPSCTTQPLSFYAHSLTSPSSLLLSADNGSGTTLNLALALALDKAEKDPSFTPLTNRVRFCWWAAEEVGLRGSQHYVTQAVAEGLKVDGRVGERIPQDIQVNLNYDITGSPNFVFGVWDGDTFTAPNQNTPRSINGSLATTRLYETYFSQSPPHTL